MIEALTYYIEQLAGTAEFSIMDCHTEYLLRIKSKNSEALQMLEKTFTKSGHQTDSIGHVLIIWLAPNDWLISSALSRYNETQQV